jgi:hypothetical protein
VVRTAMKNFPSKRASRARRALRQMSLFSSTFYIDHSLVHWSELAVFGHP